MASIYQLLTRLDNALLHLDLESAVPHPFRFFLRKGWETTNPIPQAFLISVPCSLPSIFTTEGAGAFRPLN
jgi:hypothetical protein